jgi:DnaJ-class molecular chaperone
MDEEKDYYGILGVCRTETACGIRRAYRRLAMIHHPDKAGPEGTRFFQEITEAYSVLSDPQARESYTQCLHRKEEQKYRCREKNIAARHSQSGFRRPAGTSILKGFGKTASFFEEFIDDLFAETVGLHHRRTGQQRVFDVEVILSKEESAQGGVLPLTVPVRIACPMCRGKGQVRFFQCSCCRGQGEISAEENIRIRIAPGIEDGTIFDSPVRALSGREVYLRILIRIRPQ